MTRPSPPPSERYRFLVECVRDYAIFMLDVNGCVASWNRGAQLIKGYQAEEIIGQHFSRFYPAEARDSGWPDHEIREAAAVGRFEDEAWRIRKDGTRFWANVVITAMRNDEGELLGFAKVTRDLSARRAQQELLRQSEERFRLLVESVEDYAIFMLDAAGHVMSWNPGAQRTLGYTPVEIIGKQVSLFYPPEAVDAGRPARDLAYAHEQGRTQHEAIRIRSNGARFWANVTITAVKDSDGHLRGYAKVTRDLTQTKQVAELEESSRRLTEFLAVLSHEMRNPLAPIRNMLSVMQTKQLVDPDLVMARTVLVHQVTQLTRIVEDLLDVSRVTRGAIVLRSERLALSQVVVQALEASRPLIEAREHTLHLGPVDESLVLNGDLVRLCQVLVNVLNNAAKYTSAGGQIWLTTRRLNGEVEISVRDTGKGISREDFGKLFEFFSQVEPSLERAEGGLGVGLGLVKRLVEMHGGRIEARSEGRGHGSEFVVWLPLARDEQGAEPPPAPAGSTTEREATDLVMNEPIQRRILVVDDNMDSALSLSLLLQTMGHETETAHDGLEALATVEAFQPDIVFLDIGLPKLNGYEVAQRLRAQTGDRYTLIALTGWGQDDDRRRAREAGFDRHLVKPVDTAQLTKAIAEARPQNGA